MNLYLLQHLHMYVYALVPVTALVYYNCYCYSNRLFPGGLCNSPENILHNSISLVIRWGIFFSYQNNPKNLDPSYKMDLDLWDCLGRVKFVL